MAKIYTTLQTFDGVRFSQEIIEPPIPISDALKEDQQTPQRVLKVIIIIYLFFFIYNFFLGWRTRL